MLIISSTFTLTALALLADAARQLCGEKPTMLLLIKMSLVHLFIEHVDIRSWCPLVSKPIILLLWKMFSLGKSNTCSLLLYLYALYPHLSIGFPFLECFRTILSIKVTDISLIIILSTSNFFMVLSQCAPIYIKRTRTFCVWCLSVRELCSPNLLKYLNKISTS